MHEENQSSGFYRDQFFNDLSKRLERMEKDIADIKTRVVYMYGFAAAIGLMATLFIEWVKSFLKKGN